MTEKIEIVKPHKIKKGMTIGFIAPASATSEDLERLEALWQKAGFRSVFGKTCYSQGLYGGTAVEQAHEFNYFMTNASVDAVIALRGGYGSMRYLDKIDYAKIRQWRKPFVGFSDCTALHWGLYLHSGLMSIHGPMAVNNLKQSAEDNSAYNDMQNLVYLLEKQQMKLKVEDLAYKNQPINKIVKGRLLGGNLSLLANLLGTPWGMRNMKDNILFIEDVGEKPYRIDRMLQQLRLSGILEEVSGIAVGTFSNCLDEYERENFEISERILDYLPHSSQTVVFKIAAGHSVPNNSLLIGAIVELNLANSILRSDDEFTRA